MMKWISVKDRLPTDEEQPVLIQSSVRTWYQFTAWLSELHDDPTFILFHPHTYDTDIIIPSVTHWMPLIKPPKGINNDDED